MSLFSTALKWVSLSLSHVKPEAVEFEAATVEEKIDLRGLEDLLIWNVL